MLPSTHNRMRRAVDAYLDGEPPPARAAAVEAHLTGRWGCRGDAETLRLRQGSLRRLGHRRLTLARLCRSAAGLLS